MAVENKSIKHPAVGKVMKVLITLSSFLYVSLFTPLISLSLMFPKMSYAVTCDPADPAIAEQISACEAESDIKEWNQELCKCATKEDVEAIRDAHLECNEIEDTNERQSCIDQVAANATGELANDAKATKEVAAFDGTVTGVALGVAIINFAAQDLGGCMSATVMALAALASIASEAYLWIFTQKSLRELRDEYRKTITCDAEFSEDDATVKDEDGNTVIDEETGEAQSSVAADSKSSCIEQKIERNSFEAQKLAFDFLYREQEQIKEIAGARKTAYIIAAVAGGLVAATAIYDIIQSSGSGNCSSGNSGGGNSPGAGGGTTYWDDNNLKDNGPFDLYAYRTAQKEIDFYLDYARWKERNVMLHEKLREAETKDQKFWAWMETEKFYMSDAYQSPAYDLFYELERIPDYTPEKVAKKSLFVNMFFDEVHAQEDGELEEGVSRGGEEGSNLHQGSTEMDFSSMLGVGSNVETSKLFAALIGVGGGLIIGGVAQIPGLEGFKEFLQNAWVLLVLGLLMAALNSYLAYMAGVQEQQAADNMQTVDDIRNQFIASMENFCPDGRDSLEDARCFCFLDNGEKNPDRTESDTCKALFEIFDGTALVPAVDPSAGDPNNPVGCITRTKEFDQTCECKKFVDADSGQNACFQVPVGSVDIGSLGIGIGAGETINDLNSLTSGGLSTGALSSNQEQRLAASRDAVSRLKPDLVKKRQDAGFPPPPTTSDLAADIANNRIGQDNLKKLSTSSPLSFQGQLASLAPDDPAIKDALEKTGINNAVKYEEGDLSKKKTEDKKKFDLSLGDSGGGPKNSVVGGNFMEKSYKYKGSDIVKNNGASIWKVISNRYNVSGYARLFEGEDQ